jgi:PAS domain S-box-containing protein
LNLEDVLITDALAQRPSRTPNLQAETEAFHTLARQLAEAPQTMLRTLVTVAKDLCQAGSAGMSLLEVTPDGTEVFRWVAVAGALENYEGETAPRDFSPCGVCLDRQSPQLYSYPERHFTQGQAVTFPIVEGLVIPLISATQALGAIWIVSHDSARQFDREDVRILTSLANFTAAALHSIQLRQTAEAALQCEQAARREAEANRRAFNESARRAVEILESITDAFVCVDGDWRITYINQEAARLIDRQPEEIVGRSRQDAPVVIQTVLEQTYDRVTADPKVTHFETFDRTSGRWLEIHAYPCKIGFSLYFRDITERKRDKFKRQQAETALRKSESLFRLIVESAEDFAIFTLDLDGRITSWNPGAERMLGYQEAEIIGELGRIIFTPEDKEAGKAEEELETALSEGRAEDDRWHLRKDGSRFFASGLMMQLRDESGHLQGLFKILRDITEAHQAQEREQFLAQASDVLASTLDCKTMLGNVAHQIVPFLGDFCVFDIFNNNYQIERLAWHHADPAKEKWFERVQQEHENPLISNVLATGRADLASDVTEDWLQTAAIEPLQELQVRSLITVPLIARGRKLGAFTLCFTEHSDRRYSQTDLAVAEELGRRTALALDNARLYQQAQEANRMKDEFLAVLSHELRSPLNPILGWLQMIRRGNMDAARTERAWTTIERNAKLQAQLVEDLLDVSRILQGKLSLNMGQVNLALTIRAALETVQLASQAKSIAIETKLDPQIPSILGDVTRLQQVVWNLLSNAIKFTSEKGRVEVSLEQIDNQAQIRVKDTGVGIPPSFLPYVFDYFRQADGATTRRFGGLGLGLAIVRQIVEAHGGTVGAESLGEGQGATFTVRLPLTLAQPTTSERQPSEDAFDLRGVQILVVDNEPDALEVAAFVLEQTGATVTTANSAAEALSLFTESKPEILVSDIGMPDVDGYMLMEQVRCLEALQQESLPPEKRREIPAIALTAYAGEINHQQAIASGFQRHLAKPVEPELLVQTIAELLKEKPRQ